jgi:hypothetical protein
MLQSEVRAGRREVLGAVTDPVVGQDFADRDPEPGVIGDRGARLAASKLRF